MSFSGWLPQALWSKELSALPSVAPSRVLLVHGTEDSKVLFDRGTAAREALTGKVASVAFQQFRGDHGFCPSSVAWLEAFMREGLQEGK